MTKPQLSAIGYVRVSSVGGRSGPEYHTLDIQRASIERVCRERGYELIDTLIDENRSGRTRRRPNFQVALERTLSGECDAIAVWKVSRFSRNWAEAAQDTEQLLSAGKDLISGEEGFDTTTTGGRALLRMLFVLAAWEHEVLGEGWDVLKRRVVAERGATLGHAGLGYITGPGGRLEVDPETAVIVRELFERRASGQRMGELARWLDTQAPRRKSRQGTKDVRRILSRRAYLGEARWQDVVVPDAHEPIISRDLWERAHAVAVDDGTPLPRPNTKRIYPLSGVLRCTSCGGPMSGSSDRVRKKLRPSYKCSRRSTNACPRPLAISAAAAETAAMAAMDSAMDGVTAAGVPPDGADELTELRRAILDIDDALSDVASLEMRRVLDEDWLPTMKRLRDEKIVLQRRIDALLRRTGLSRTLLRWNDLEAEQKWDALRGAVDRIDVVAPARGLRPEERIVIVWASDDEPHPVTTT